jgi:hypothetical protein
MANPVLFYNPKPQFFTSTGTMASGYLLFFYTAGTTTKKDTYPTSADAIAGTSPNTNPIVLNSRGEANVDIYLDGSYKVKLAPSTDTDPPTAAIWTVDNVYSLTQLVSTLSKTTNYTVTTSDKNKVIFGDATAGAFTITLPSAASCGDGFRLGVKKVDASSNRIIVDANASETIDTPVTYVLISKDQAISLITNGTAWFIESSNIVESSSTAVNSLSIVNKATGVAPTLKTVGEANIGQTFLDSNGNEVLKLTAVAAAVNEISISNQITATPPSIQSTGDDANIYLDLYAKGNLYPRTYAGTTATVATSWGILGSAKLLIHSINALTTARTVTWPDCDIPQHVVQTASTTTGAVNTGTTIIPYDDSIPQITEGDEYMTLAITPKSATNILYINVSIWLSGSAASSEVAAALFQDATAAALAATGSFMSTANGWVHLNFSHQMVAGTTSSTTFRVRGGTGQVGTTTFNGQGSTRKYGGKIASSITIMEVTP